MTDENASNCLSIKCACYSSMITVTFGVSSILPGSDVSVTHQIKLKLILASSIILL
jgi:hypothetical protein